MGLREREEEKEEEERNGKKKALMDVGYGAYGFGN